MSTQLPSQRFVPGAHGAPSNKMSAYYCDGVAYNVEMLTPSASAASLAVK